MMEAVANESVKKVAKFAPQDLQGAHEQQLSEECIIPCPLRHQDMANVAWGLAKQGLLHEQLLEVLSRDFVARANECQASPCKPKCSGRRMGPSTAHGRRSTSPSRPGLSPSLAWLLTSSSRPSPAPLLAVLGSWIHRVRHRAQSAMPTPTRNSAASQRKGVGNSLWAFGVLCFWHRRCVKACTDKTRHLGPDA